MSFLRQSPKPSKASALQGAAPEQDSHEDQVRGKSMSAPPFQLKTDGEGGDDKQQAEKKPAWNWSGAVLGGAIGGLGGGLQGMLMGGMAGGLFAGQIEKLLTVGSKKAESFDDIKAILETIPTGKEALKRYEDYKITISFVPGGGSYYSGGVMTIDSNETVREAALTFVHEMNHAFYEKTGLTKNVATSTREEYVKGNVEEEAEGTVKSIEAKIELEGTIIDTKGLTFPLEGTYRAAYKTAYDKAFKEKSSEADAKTAARAAGKQAVIQGFLDGKVQTSNSGETYSDYYGKDWDSNHPGGK